MKKPFVYILLGLVLFYTSVVTAQKNDCNETAVIVTTLGKIEYSKTNAFDKLNNLTNSEEKFYEGGFFKYAKRIELQYNNKNQIIKQTDFLNNKLISENNKVYDIQGKIVSETGKAAILSNNQINDLVTEKIFTDNSGKSISKEQTIKNNSGEIVENIFFNGKNEILKKETYTYYADKNIKGKEVQDIVGNTSFKTEFKYANNNITEQKEWINNELSNYTTNIYNNNLIVSKANYDKSNTLQYKIIYVYNEAEKLAEQIFENIEGRLYSVKFSFDKSGNIIKEQQYDKTNILIRTTERTYNCK